MSVQVKHIVEFVRDHYRTSDFIPLHAPIFDGNEKKYIADTIDSTFVSSVGEYVNEFERSIEGFTAAKKAVATTNGTSALHAALFSAGVSHQDIVITQALTFVATGNAILQLGAEPAFVDVSRKSLGMCPIALSDFLTENAILDGAGQCRLKESDKKVKAVVPMHTFGHPVEIDELLQVCHQWNLLMIEDAAESLGSYYKGQHTGTFGEYGILSFNGNKIITTGGGGMVLSQNTARAEHLKHITTTAKRPHSYEFYHDQHGFNYRMPNLNAAMGVAQMEKINDKLASKRLLAMKYASLFEDSDYEFISEPDYAKSNFWLNAIMCKDKQERDSFLKETNDSGIMTRPVWELMTHLPMFKSSMRGDLSVSQDLSSRLINLPSSPLVK